MSEWVHGLGNLPGFSDPLTNDLFGWFTGGKDQNSLIEMFGGPPGEKTWGALAGQEQNVGASRDIWNSLFNAASKNMGLAQPLQETVMARAKDILSGNYDPTKSPMYSPMRKSVEQSYGGAKENILANLPTGGVQLEALGDLEGKRAGSLSDIMGQISTGELQNAYGTAANAYPTAISALSQAAQAGQYPGQMMGSILEYLAKLLSASAQGQSALTQMI